MPSKFELLASLNIDSEWSDTDEYKRILKACHYLYDPRYDATILADVIFDILADGVLSTTYPDEEGAGLTKLSDTYDSLGPADQFTRPLGEFMEVRKPE